MLYNINPSQTDLKEDDSLQHISVLLNTINKTFKLLDQQISVYRQDFKNHTFLFYGPRDDFETRAKIMPNIQKELEVYHYYEEITLKLLREFFAQKIVKRITGVPLFQKIPLKLFARYVFCS